MQRLSTIPELRRAIATARADGDRVALVPTLGALHAGHLANVRLAAEVADTVVVSIFVNPTQFDRPDDLAAYPRDLAGDEAALVGLGDAAPRFVFVPSDQEIYPRPPATRVHVAGVTERLEGAARPGHFDGVATIVTKLFNIVQPDLAVFGRKDAQQNQVIRRLVDDLDIPVELVLAPTIREPDGLALSSRNRRLSTGDRQAAAVVPQALRAAVEAARRARADGRAVTADLLRAAAAGTLSGVPDVAVDYLEVVDPDTFAPPDDPGSEEADPRDEDDDAAGVASSGGTGTLLVAIAAFVGPVRLIDNIEVGDPDDEQRLLAATETLPIPDRAPNRE